MTGLTVVECNVSFYVSTSNTRQFVAKTPKYKNRSISETTYPIYTELEDHI